ncbi:MULTISPECIES: SMP-30/gluconolactonase/LRE family protein [unclassified Pseudofrankia]|uniref:SMP-30/gluconolactonase/LRE family protein n=1 Tax=unclassified Pseudofrankia TaxID=2994372 RepID=UPI0008DACB44|nr:MULTISPECIES: SMP-30/gluconolactonase/LRE family protein [unclassified Pseudofrankia]MDT3439872.1 SMP-30/gluconolactonase/LRE family protein [Pseudofrankia sp. BMG5.37]OHV48349.1 gluconolaconase [Pseudofrankia sp. BMG5.36]
MLLQGGRYTSPTSTSLAEGWSLERLTPPSRLFGANGLRTGPDGRIYVAQVAGSQISALNVDTGELATVSAQGGDIVAPDDVAFDAQGNLYATEYYDGRVAVRETDGSTRVLRDDVPGANGITIHQGRLFIDECRIGGRLLEMYADGSAPRVLVENLPMPNAMEFGPDGKLYYPVLGTNDIWRIDVDGGEPERVVGDLGVPDAVKFDAEGYIISTQVGTGEVLRINPRNGERTTLASIAPGLDNLTFVGDRLFVSSFTGQITEILGGGGGTRQVLPGGLTWPLDLTVGPDGILYVSDGTYFYFLPPGGDLRMMGFLFSPGWPGYIRGVTAVGEGEFIVSTSNGQLARWRPAAMEHDILAGETEPFDQLYGVAIGPDGGVAAAELGAGRVVSVRGGQVATLASGLDRPMGVAFAGDGTCLVSESGAGRVVSVASSGVDTVVDGLETPQGILVRDGKLLIVDAGAKSLVKVDLGSKSRATIARDLPVGPPLGVEPKPLKGLQPFSGPQGLFAGIAAGPDGTIYLSADAEGSVLAFRQDG